MEYAPGGDATGTAGAAGLVGPQSLVTLSVYSIGVRLNNSEMPVITEAQKRLCGDGFADVHALPLLSSNVNK